MGRPKSTRICSFVGCTRPHNSRGFCSAHYNHFSKYGNPGKRLRNPMGEGGLDGDGYWVRHRLGKRITEHVEIAEKILGKPLPKGAQIHHVNEIRTDNRPSNLVICQDNAYHKLLHKRKNAIKAGFPPFYLKCYYCHNYDSPKNLYIRGYHVRHKECAALYLRRRKSEKIKAAVYL